MKKKKFQIGHFQVRKISNFQIGRFPNRDFPSKIFAKGNITISKGKNKFPKAYIFAKICSEIG